jgi:hypothetical protein
MPDEHEETAGKGSRKSRVRLAPAPQVQRLAEAGRLRSGSRILCYGCGRGADLSWLKRRNFEVSGYDPWPPYGFSAVPAGRYDYVLLVYLLPRLKTDEKRRAAIAKAWQYVRPGGWLVIISRNWRKLAEASGGRDREAAIARLAGLMDTFEYGETEAPELDPEDIALCLMARKPGIYTPRRPVEWVDSADGLAAACRALAGQPRIGLDVETTLGEEKTLCTVQLGAPDGTRVVDALALDNLAPLKELMENEAVMKIIHNAAFEEQVLGRNSMKIRNIYDTLIHSRKKYKGQQVTGSHKLGDVCERELNIYLDKEMQTSDWTQRPLTPEQLAYAAIDAEVLIDLFDAFNPPPPPETLALF